MKTINAIFAICLTVAMGTASAATPEEARQALDAACPGFKTYASDLKIDKALKEPASLDAQRDRKWKDVYTFNVKVSDKPAPELFTKYKAQGQSCSFSVDAAGGKEVQISKSACQAVCKAKQFSAGSVAYFGVDGSELLKP